MSSASSPPRHGSYGREREAAVASRTGRSGRRALSIRRRLVREGEGDEPCRFGGGSFGRERATSLGGGGNFADMTWTKSRHRRIIARLDGKGGSGSADGSRPHMSGDLGSRVDALLTYEKSQLIAAEKNRAILRKVEIPPANETPKFILSTVCSAQEFHQFQDKIKEYNLKVAPYSIPVEIDGVKSRVPVTPLQPRNIDHAGCHIIVLRSPYEHNEIHFLVENHSGYIKAFAVVLIGHLGSYDKWYRLGKDKLARRFSPSVRTDYDDGYGVLTGIYMDSGMFELIFKFFLGFKY